MDLFRISLYSVSEKWDIVFKLIKVSSLNNQAVYFCQNLRYSMPKSLLNQAVFMFLFIILPLSTKFDGESTEKMFNGSFPGKGILWNRNRCIANGVENDTDKGITFFYIP